MAYGDDLTARFPPRSQENRGYAYAAASKLPNNPSLGLSTNQQQHGGQASGRLSSQQQQQQQQPAAARQQQPGQNTVQNPVGFDPDQEYISYAMLSKFRELLINNPGNWSKFGRDLGMAPRDYVFGKLSAVGPDRDTGYVKVFKPWDVHMLMRTLVVQMPGHPDAPDGSTGSVKCYKVPSATALDGCFIVIRKPKQLEIDLATAKAAGCPVECRYTADEAAALDDNDPALFISVKLPHNVDELLLTLEHMNKGGSSGNKQRFYRFVPKLFTRSGDAAAALSVMKLLLDPQQRVFDSSSLQVFSPDAHVLIHGGNWATAAQPLPSSSHKETLLADVPAAGATLLYIHAYHHRIWCDNSSTPNHELPLMADEADLERIHQLRHVQVAGFNHATASGHVQGIMDQLRTTADGVGWTNTTREKAFAPPLDYIKSVQPIEREYRAAWAGLSAYTAWFDRLPKEQQKQAQQVLQADHDHARKVPSAAFAQAAAVARWSWHVDKAVKYMKEQFSRARAAASAAANKASLQAAAGGAAAPALHEQFSSSSKVTNALLTGTALTGLLRPSPAIAAAVAAAATRGTTAAEAAAGTSMHLPARVTTSKLVAAAAAPRLEPANLRKQQRPAPPPDIQQEPAKQRRTVHASITTPPSHAEISCSNCSNAPSSASASTAAAAEAATTTAAAAYIPAPAPATRPVPTSPQHLLPCDHIPFTHFLEGSRLWFLGMLLSADASKDVVKAITEYVDQMWQHMQQLHESKFLILSPLVIETKMRKQQLLQLCQRGHVVLLGGTAEAIQFKQQLGQLNGSLDVQQGRLIREALQDLVDAKTSTQARFELQYSKPLFKLRSVFELGDRDDGDGRMQREQSAGCSVEAPCHGVLSSGIRLSVFRMKMLLLLAYKLQALPATARPAELQQLLLLLPAPVVPLMPQQPTETQQAQELMEDGMAGMQH